MDEPFAALDAQTRSAVRDEFLRIWDNEVRRKTVLFVTHDLTEALLLADRIVTVANGTIRTDVCVPFDRPRSQRALMKCTDYHDLYDTIQADLTLSQ